MPSLPRAALENAIRNVNIKFEESSKLDVTKISTKDGKLQIGNTETELYQTNAVTKVPDITFYDVPQHLRLLEHLLQVLCQYLI